MRRGASAPSTPRERSAVTASLLALAAGLLGGLSVSEINVLARGFADTPEGARYLEAAQEAAAAAALGAAPGALDSEEPQDETKTVETAGVP